MYGAPREWFLQIFIESAKSMIYPAVENKLGCPLFDLFGTDSVQKRHRIMIDLPPKMRIQIAKQPEDLRVPCPPKVLSQYPQPLMKILCRFWHAQLPSLRTWLESLKSHSNENHRCLQFFGTFGFFSDNRDLFVGQPVEPAYLVAVR
jgi:hypothetical protein